MFMCMSFKVWEKRSHSGKLIDSKSSWSNRVKRRLRVWEDWRGCSDFTLKTLLVAFKPPECQANLNSTSGGGGGGVKDKTRARQILFSLYPKLLPVSFYLIYWTDPGLGNNQITKAVILSSIFEKHSSEMQMKIYNVKKKYICNEIQKTRHLLWAPAWL